jgi:hypothetical protein
LICFNPWNSLNDGLNRCEQRVFWASIRDMLVDVGRNVLLCFREDNAPVSVCDPHPLLMGGEVLEAVQFPSIAAARQHLQFVLDSIEKVRCVAIEDGTEAYDHIRVRLFFPSKALLVFYSLL